MDWKDIFFKADELNYLELFIRTSILYFVLFLADKSLGFRQPGIVTPYNFLVAAGISHIAASRMVQPQSRPIDAIAIIIVYILIILLISYSYLKVYPHFASKRQLVLVEKGVVRKENLRKSLLTIDNLFSIMRQRNIFELKNVDYLIAEPNGDYSVGKNSRVLPVSKSAMKIPAATKELSRIIIYEGILDKKSLKDSGLSLDWVQQQLQMNHVSDISEVYIGLLTPDRQLYINK